MALPVQIETKLARATELYAQVEHLLTDDNASAEDKAHIEEFLKEADSLYAEVFELDRVQKAYNELQSFASGQRKSVQSRFATTGEFLLSVWKAGSTQQRDPRLEWFEDEKIVSKDLNEAIGASGGFLVPPEHSTDVMSVAAETAIFASRATRIPMRRRQITIPVLDQTGTTAGQPHWFGGIQGYWAAEAALKILSEPTWRMINLVAHEIIGFTRASNALLDDAAISLEAFFNGPLGFNGVLGWMVDYATIRGTGAGQPRGWLDHSGTIVVDRATSGTITYPDLLNMLQRFLAVGGQGMWMASQSALSTLAQINGPAGNPSYVWLMDASSGIPGRLLGYPIIFTEKLPVLGQQGDIALVNPSFYLFGDRQAVTVESTPFENWRYNQHSWRAVARVDGQPWLSDPLTLQDGTSQLSPFVVLGDTAT